MYTIQYRSPVDNEVIEERSIDERCEAMWMAAGMDILDYQGVSAHETEISASQSLRNLRASPNFFQNFYSLVRGDYSMVEDFMEFLVDMAGDAPDLVIEVRY